MPWNLREGIRQALLNNGAIAALVGTRVYGGFAPATAPAAGPWIVFVKLLGAEEGAMSGDQKLTHPTYQFTVGGTNKVQVNEVQRLLCKLNGTNYVYSATTLTFFHRDDRDAWNDGARVQAPTVDLEIWAEEP